MATRTDVLQIKLTSDGAGAVKAELLGVRDGLGGLGKEAGGAEAMLGRLKGTLAGIGFAATAKMVMGLAESYKGITARLRNATDGQEDFATALAATTAIANETGQPLESIAGLYGKLRMNAQMAAGDAERLTTVLAKATQLDGGGAGAEAALFQLQQGLASGTLRGEELNSVLEQTPTLALAIADGLGISIGALRDYASEGKLTAEAVKTALFDQQSTIEAQFSELPVTAARAFQNVRTSAMRELGEMDAELGATEFFANALQGIADNFGEILNVGGLVAAMLGGRMVAALGTATVGLVRTTTATQAMTGALGMARGALALLGGPAGLVLTAAAGIAYWASGADDAKDKARGWREEIDNLVLSHEELTRKQFDQAIAAQEANIKAQEQLVLSLHARQKNDQYATPGTAIYKQYLAELHAEQDELDGMRTGLEQLLAKRDGGGAQKGTANGGASSTPTSTKEGASRIAALEREIALHGKASELEKARYEVTRGALADIAPAEKERVVALAAQVDAQKEIAKQSDITKDKWLSMQGAGADVFMNTRTETELLGMEQDRLNDLLDQGAIDWDTYTRAMIAAEERTEKVNKKTTTFSEEMNNAVTGWASNFSASLNEMAWESEGTFEEILRAFMKMITQMIIQKAVVGPLLNSMGFGSTTASAHGNAFSGGRVMAFASGGAFTNSVVSSPTLAPMALFGEAGPEAIMPLTRTAGGDLGVMAVGGGGNNNTVVQIIDQRQGGEAPQVSQSQGPDGSRMISVLIRDGVKGAFTDGTMDRTMNTLYGLRRRGV